MHYPPKLPMTFDIRPQDKGKSAAAYFDPMRNVRYWLKADIGLTRAEWRLPTQSGHSVRRFNCLSRSPAGRSIG